MADLRGHAEGGSPHGVEPGGDYEIAVREARAALELGVKTIVDPTAMFLGRDVEFMRRVAEETGLQVVPCTGIYTYDHLPQFLLNRNVDQIADLFVADIEGIQGTEIKAAFIKCAADEPGVNENIEKIHRAAARASVRPERRSWPIPGPPATPPPADRDLRGGGVDLAKVQIAHTGDTDDLDYIEGVLEKGVWIGLDRYGLELFLRTRSGRRPPRRCSSAATPTGCSSRRTRARPSTGSPRRRSGS